jgi:hypothetical protein
VAVLALLLLWAAAAPAPAMGRACPGPPAEVLATSRSAVMTGLAADLIPGDRDYTDVVGCVTRDRRGFELTDYDHDEFGRSPMRLGGRWAGLAVHGLSGETFYTGLKVVRLPLPGERRREFYLDSELCGDCATFTDAEISTNGSVAWISQRGRTYTVQSCGRAQCLDAKLESTVLARGRGINPRSLRMHGRKIRWYDGKHRRTATLH